MKKYLSANNLKVNSWILYISLLIISLGIAFILPKLGLKAGIVILGLLIALPIAIYSLINIEFGVAVLIVFAFLFSILNRMAEGAPLGIAIDAFIFLLLVGLLFRKWKANDFHLAKTPLSYAVWLWLIYNCLEVFNPMASVEAWVYVIRAISVRMLFFFVVLEAATSLTFFRRTLILWISLAFLAAAYGLFQEFHGLLPMDRNWVMADKMRFHLFFIWGRFRIFSIFNDPTACGILMSVSGLFCIILASYSPIKFIYKLLLIVAACTMFLTTVYTGTRTAYALIPAGFVFFAFLTSQLKTIFFTGIIFIFGAVIIFSDINFSFISQNSLDRVRSAFKPKEDPSFLVREKNQAMIKPFIQTHAFGSGLGSIGIWGERFTPNSPLAGFDPDSGYVRAAVETGWVGLIIYCGLLATALITGIRNFYKVTNPELKAYMAGLVSVLYAYTVAEYPQQAIIQLPNIFIFLVAIASIIKLKHLDIKLRTE